MKKADVSIGLHQRRSDILFLQILGIARFDFAFSACEQAMDIFLVAQNYKESGNHRENHIGRGITQIPRQRRRKDGSHNGAERYIARQQHAHQPDTEACYRNLRHHKNQQAQCGRNALATLKAQKKRIIVSQKRTQSRNHIQQRIVEK